MQCVKVCRGEYNIAHQSDFLIRRTENGSKLYLGHSFLNPVEVRRRDPAVGYEKPRADNHRQQHSDGDPERSAFRETHKAIVQRMKKPRPFWTSRPGARLVESPSMRGTNSR